MYNLSRTQPPRKIAEAVPPAFSISNIHLSFEIVDIILSYLSDALEKTCVIAGFCSTLTYDNKEGKKEDWPKATITEYLQTQTLTNLVNRQILLSILKIAVKNFEIINHIIAYSTQQLHGCYVSLHLTLSDSKFKNKSSSLINSEEYKKNKSKTLLFFNFVQTGIFLRSMNRLKTDTQYNNTGFFYTQCMYEARKVLEKCPDISKKNSSKK